MVKIYRVFLETAKNEKEHERRCVSFLEDVENKQILIKEDMVIWQCLNRGHVSVGRKVPGVCPVCSYPQSYSVIKTDNY